VIAVVDDEELVCKAVVRLLRAAGYSARGFASGHELLDSLVSYRPECVVLDLQMPGLSGVQVQRLLKETGARVRVIIITAHDSPGAREECMREGAFAYLCKPLPDRTLLNAVAAALDSPA
jgi:FixJ family two-component response regulator